MSQENDEQSFWSDELIFDLSRKLKINDTKIRARYRDIFVDIIIHSDVLELSVGETYQIQSTIENINKRHDKISIISSLNDMITYSTSVYIESIAQTKTNSQILLITNPEYLYLINQVQNFIYYLHHSWFVTFNDITTQRPYYLVDDKIKFSLN